LINNLGIQIAIVNRYQQGPCYCGTKGVNGNVENLFNFQPDIAGEVVNHCIFVDLFENLVGTEFTLFFGIFN